MFGTWRVECIQIRAREPHKNVVGAIPDRKHSTDSAYFAYSLQKYTLPLLKVKSKYQINTALRRMESKTHQNNFKLPIT